MAEMGLGAPGRGAGGNWFLPQGPKKGRRLSCVLHVLPPVAPESCFYDYSSTPPADISESPGNYNIQCGSRTHQHQFWELTSLPATQTVEVKIPLVTKRWLQRDATEILMGQTCLQRCPCYLQPTLLSLQDPL